VDVYVCPWSPSLLNGKIFDNTSGNVASELWKEVAKECQRRGIEIQTIDRFRGEPEESVFVALSRIPLSDSHWKHYVKMATRIGFKRRILLHTEPPVIAPQMFIFTERLNYYFTDIYYPFHLQKTYFAGKWIQKLLLNRNITKIKYLPLTSYFDGIIPEFFYREKRSFAVMVAKNLFPLVPAYSLLGKRIDIVNFFSKTSEFDLYGIGWNRFTLYPRYLDKRATSKHFKGPFIRREQRDLAELYSRYDYGICIENSNIPGWITEKIFDFMAAGTVPVYFGSKEVYDFVPADCFIDGSSFPDLDALYRYMISNRERLPEYKLAIKRFMTSEQYMSYTPKSFAKRLVDIFQS